MNPEILIVGIGPGRADMLTPEADAALRDSEVIVGYPVYLKLLGDRYAGREFLSTPMREEEKRCRMCFAEAQKGKKVALVCSGDAGIYGMASLMYELSGEYPDCPVRVIPGITAASSGAAELGAPLNHDFCVISLSDLLTPWERIEKRLAAAAMGDFAMAIYNPSSRKRTDYLQKACDILIANGVETERVCGYVENIGREGTSVVTCTLGELREAQVNMFTTVFIGNSQSRIIDGKLVTPRGYQLEEI
jgi:precorrin-3B C17-methyltransferase